MMEVDALRVAFFATKTAKRGFEISPPLVKRSLSVPNACDRFFTIGEIEIAAVLLLLLAPNFRVFVGQFIWALQRSNSLL